MISSRERYGYMSREEQERSLKEMHGREWVEYATRKSVLNPERWAEGVVVRPMVDTYEHLLGNHLSFKVINNSWLLEEK